MSIWSSFNISFLAIANVLLLLAITGEHFTECAPTPMWGYLCTLSGNAFALKELGYEAIKAGTGNADHIYLIDCVRVCTLVQFFGAFIAWGLFVMGYRTGSAELTALTHFAGWALLGVIVTEIPYFNALIDPSILGTQSTTDFSFGNGIVMSIIATSIQLVVVVSILLERRFN